MAGKLQGIGFEGLTFGPLKMSYGPKGMTTHFTVSCLTIAPLINYYNYIVQFGASGEFLGCDVGVDGTTGAEVKKLEVSVPGLVNNLASFLEELFFDSWELVTNESTDSIFNNPLIVGTSGWMNDNDKVVLSYVACYGVDVNIAVSKLNAAAGLTPQTQRYPITGGTGASPSLYQNPSDARSVQTLLEIQKGQTEFSRPSKVLRHTSYCSAGSTYNTSIAYEECIYTKTQLLAEVSSGWTYNLPLRLISEISAEPIQFAAPAEAPYYTWGWKKTVGREPVLSNFIVEREVEYCLGLWSNLKYALR